MIPDCAVDCSDSVVRIFPRILHRYWLSCFNVFCNLRWYFLPSQAAGGATVVVKHSVFYILCPVSWVGWQLTGWHSPGVTSSCVRSWCQPSPLTQIIALLSNHWNWVQMSCDDKYHPVVSLHARLCCFSPVRTLVWAQSDWNWEQTRDGRGSTGALECLYILNIQH